MQDKILEIIVVLLTGGNILQFFTAWKNRKSDTKSADARATTELADSLKITGEVYTFLTEITKRELSEMATKIEKLEGIVEEYKRKCGECNLTKKK